MYDDCDLPEFCEVKDVKKSRKPHACCECGDEISTGSSYVLITGKWDGQVSSYKQHNECADACRSIRDYSGDGCIPFGYYSEWLSDNYGYRNRLHPHIRRMLTIMIKKHEKIREQIKSYVTEYDDWYLPAKVWKSKNQLSEANAKYEAFRYEQYR